ncbi:hypothetical protein BH18ACT4_BH18ACT4_04920 [soil metagenome]
MIRFRRLAAGLSAIALGTTVLALSGAAPAQANHIACGAMITTDIVLDSDIGPCSGMGLHVAAHNITVDLNGYRIIGNNRFGDTAGVHLMDVHGVTVKNGTVEGFDGGVIIEGGSQNTVQGITARDNIGNGDCNFGDGIGMFDSHDNTITGNQAIHNGPYSGISAVGDSDNNLISGNTAAENNVNSSCSGGEDEGIRIEGPGASGNRVENNVITKSLLAGVGLHGYVCSGPQSGEPNTGTTVVGNTISRSNGGANSGAPAGIAILRQGPAGIVCPSYANTIENNTSTQNQADGVFVSSDSANNFIRGNTVKSNGRDGIHLSGPVFSCIGEELGSVFDVEQPDLAPYVPGEDYVVANCSGAGDVTAPVQAVGGIIIPPTPEPSSAAGCTEADYAGFVPGNVALVQRGTCSFVTKVALAEAAGASAIILFNEGNPDRTAPIFFGISSDPHIPALGTSFAVGEELFNLLQSGDEVIVHIVVNAFELVALVPGSTQSTVADNLGRGNVVFDGFDGTLNPPCDDNIWTDNRFRTVNQRCVAAGGTGTVPPAPRVVTREVLTGATVEPSRNSSVLG